RCEPAGGCSSRARGGHQRLPAAAHGRPVDRGGRVARTRAAGQPPGRCVMARMFPLAGLLRLRQIQEEQAASDLAVANARAREIASRQSRARKALGSSSAEVSSPAVLYAVAAARASSRSMLAELDSLDCEHQPVLDQANEAFAEARARSIGLEKLAG